MSCLWDLVSCRLRPFSLSCLEKISGQSWLSCAKDKPLASERHHLEQLSLIQPCVQLSSGHWAIHLANDSWGEGLGELVFFWFEGTFNWPLCEKLRLLYMAKMSLDIAILLSAQGAMRSLPGRF